jgi:hypothetical protein
VEVVSPYDYNEDEDDVTEVVGGEVDADNHMVYRGLELSQLTRRLQVVRSFMDMPKISNSIEQSYLW